MKIMFSLKDNDKFKDTRVLATRAHDAAIFKVTKPNSFLFQNSVAHIGPRDWNNLSTNVRATNDINRFDRLIKNHYWAVFTEGTWTCLKIQYKERCNIAVNNKYEVLSREAVAQTEDDNRGEATEKEWEIIKECMAKAASEVLPKRKKEHKQP